MFNLNKMINGFVKTALEFCYQLGMVSALLGASLLTSGCALDLNSSGGNTASGLYFYVAASNSVDHVQIDATTGVPSLQNSYSLTSTSGTSVAVSHNESFLYVGTSGGHIEAYFISPIDGSLTSVGTTNYGSAIADMLMHPSKNYLYILDSGATEGVTVYDVNTVTGALSERFSKVATGQSDTYEFIFSKESSTDPKFLFASNTSSNNTSVFQIDQSGGASDGAVTLRENETSSLHPAGLVTFIDDSSGVHIYQAGRDSSDVLGASTDLVSRLTFTDDGVNYINTWDPFNVNHYSVVENESVNVHLDEVNDRLLVANILSDNINIFNITTADGTLTEDSSSPVLLPDGNASSGVVGPGDMFIYDSKLYVLEYTANGMTVLNLSSLSAYNGGTRISVSTDPYRFVFLNHND